MLPLHQGDLPFAPAGRAVVIAFKAGARMHDGF
jgi:hypothetical protein